MYIWLPNYQMPVLITLYMEYHFGCRFDPDFIGADILISLYKRRPRFYRSDMRKPDIAIYIEMGNFKYDLITLFELIEERPCLWDKKSEDYRNRILREKSWLEICQFLDEHYENKTSQEKQNTLDVIQQKWQNIRDAFIRSLKSKKGQAAKRKYIYSENLQFLLNTRETSDTFSNNSQSNAEDFERSHYLEDITVYEQPSASSLYSTTQPVNSESPSDKKIIRLKRELDFIEEEDPLEWKSPKATESHTTADQAKENFFSSFYPYILDMSEDEKLDLHMELIKAIKNIKQRRTL